VRIPAFWPEDPELWFAQIDGQFALGGVSDDDTKYSYVLSKLEPKQAREIKDVITRPPSTNKYAAIKSALIQRLTDTQEQRIRQLLEREELGDCKPSQFLRHLCTLAGTTVSNELLKTLWLGRLPSTMQAILATRKDDELQDIAKQADRIHEVNSRALVLATEIATGSPQNLWATQMEALTKQVATLTEQMTSMAKEFRQGRGRARSRSRDRARSKTPRKDGICYYHRRFGAEAKKCTKPCTFQGNEKGDH